MHPLHVARGWLSRQWQSGSGRVEPQPRGKQICLLRSLPVHEGYGYVRSLPAVGHSKGRPVYRRQAASSNPISGLPTAVAGHARPIEEGDHRRFFVEQLLNELVGFLDDIDHERVHLLVIESRELGRVNFPEGL